MLLTAYAYTNLLNAIISSILSVLTLFLANKKIRLPFSILLFATANWCFGIFMHSFFNYSFSISRFWDIYLHATASFLPTLFVNFTLSYTGTINKNNKLIPFYIINALFLLSVFTKYFIFEETAISIFQHFPKAGILYYLYIAYYIYCIIYSYLLLIKHFKTSKNKKTKNQIIYIFIATCIGYIGGSTTFLPAMNINIFPYGNFITIFHTSVFLPTLSSNTN